MKELERLQKENDELRANLDLIQNAYLDVEIKSEVLSVEQDDESNTELAKANYILGRAIGKTPAQSLAEVRAEAVMDVANNWAIKKDSDYNIRRKLTAISNKIRRGDN